MQLLSPMCIHVHPQHSMSISSSSQQYLKQSWYVQHSLGGGGGGKGGDEGVQHSIHYRIHSFERRGDSDGALIKRRI